MTNIDHQKEKFALEVAEQVMDDLRSAPYPVGADQLSTYIKLVVLDAVEFGIQLGGMRFGEAE